MEKEQQEKRENDISEKIEQGTHNIHKCIAGSDNLNQN